LYILKESAQALQARLSVESKEGVGSKFRVEFPSTVSD